MINLIKKVDLYSYEGKFTFNDNGETGLKTITGGILSLFSIITVAIFIIYFLIPSFKRRCNNFIFFKKRKQSKYILFKYSSFYV